MSKLETITELLVNELTDFEKNVNQLGHEIERAESLRVKFDVYPIKGLISKLEEFGRRETERRDQYLHRLERNIEEAKIYPKWAVIAFMIFFGFSLCTGFYAYMLKSGLENEKKVAYEKGIDDYSNYINTFFVENPDSKGKFEAWKQKK
ncbi:MAG: hypothetical protein NXH90_00580 [Flavobacteriaceae bacterium]|nr:hypothetical protein [Flavobacteriaceae bacterium]